jgi:Concanavalin A-like lectin/glucanases superfamily
MAISPLWPKPPRWPIQPGTVDPNQRWVWHTRPRFILPTWEHAGAGAAQRYRRIGRGARVWQLNAAAAAMRTRYGPGVSIPTTDGAEIESLGNAGPPASWAANEPYTIALLLKGRSGGASTKHLYRSGTSSTADHILFLTSGTTPNLRHQASGGGTVTITSSVAIVNDTTWSTIVGTWRPGRLELYVDGFSRASSTAAATNTSALFGIYRWGWGFSTSQDFNGDIALIACFGSSWTPAMVRRWHADPFGFLRPWNEVPALTGSAPPATPPSTGTGVVTFLMG